MIRMLGGLVGCAERADALAAELELGLDAIRAAAARLPARPRVFFEEWDDPLISGIRWVEELVEIAGGEPIFPELRDAELGKDRIVDADEVVRERAGRDHRVVVRQGGAHGTDRRARRAGSDVPAVRDGHIYEIKSAYILQPGPAALTEGVHQLHRIVSRVAQDIADHRLRA